MTIGKQIRKYRKNQKLTLEQLAQLINQQDQSLNINKGRISRWENDMEQPRFSSVIALAKVFNISIDELANNDPEPEKVQLEISNNDFLTFQGKPLSQEELKYMTEQLAMYRSYKKNKRQNKKSSNFKS
ncbi:helix-turn-helix domain-containing protein [Lactobacillus johnsonii]|jgi:transcriptional regulator with XRE-family HTH domain|uniref:Helix-turn-helix transcriptional regulator n=1 Tax=Lactobacillus johnsonii TaxID=33959 RepID=A0A9X7T5N4_LACJH|nr:helix-turn-helix transcriptional regulator [Lactobacillus johnsonii]QIA88689.1 helix-turn-helix transcriptional regulator [Lactobacillus johnsonii]